MRVAKTSSPLVALVEDAVDGVCVGQIAAFAALRAEMTALSAVMAGLAQAQHCGSADPQPGARASDPDPEDKAFDNMPV
jgi:hypothetical protein